MKKIYITLLTVMILLLSNVGVFAAPETLDADVAGNSSGLVVVTKPQNQKDSTFNQAYIISGYGKEGTTVTLYWFDATEGNYKKFYNETTYVDEKGVTQKMQTASEVKIGTSGLFMNTISLGQGENVILVRAENGEHVQLMKLSVTKYNYNIIDIIKSLTT